MYDVRALGEQQKAQFRAPYSKARLERKPRRAASVTKARSNVAQFPIEAQMRVFRRIRSQEQNLGLVTIESGRGSPWHRSHRASGRFGWESLYLRPRVLGPLDVEMQAVVPSTAHPACRVTPGESDNLYGCGPRARDKHAQGEDMGRVGRKAPQVAHVRAPQSSCRRGKDDAKRNPSKQVPARVLYGERKKAHFAHRHRRIRNTDTYA